MMKKIFKNKKNIIIISILGILLAVGTTYALVNWTSNNYRIAIKSTCMDIIYSKGQDIDTHLTAINDDNIINSNNNTVTINSSMVFSSVNVKLSEQCVDVDAFATVEINISSLSNQLKASGIYFNSLRYIVVEYDPSDYNNLNMNELENQTFDIAARGSVSGNGTFDIYYKYLDAGDELNCLIFFYVDNKLFGNNPIDLSFDGTIGARVEQFIGTPVSDFTKTISGGNVILTKYNGSDAIIEIPSTYNINGTNYNTVVANQLFKNNTSIEEVYFANGVLSNEGNADSLFYGCTKLKRAVNLPNNITNISNAFYGCTSLVTAPVIPSSVTNMSYAFYGCTSMVNAPIIPNLVTNMSYAFYGCTSMVNAPIIPNLVISLDHTFQNCTLLETVPTIPNSVTSMINTFSSCTSLVTAPVIPSSVTDMSRTFYGCASLVNAPTIPNSVTSMNGTFSGCTSLVNAPTIPNSVTDMQYTFNGCSNLVTAPTIGSSVTTMDSTFFNCISLVNAPEIPNSVTNMMMTFQGCTSLVVAPTIPNSVTNLGYTFQNCSSLVTAPTIPSSVTFMSWTFYGCTNLTGTVRINSSNVTTSGSDYHPFRNISKNVTVEVPESSTTYTTINTNKPSRVTIVTFTS